MVDFHDMVHQGAQKMVVMGHQNYSTGEFLYLVTGVVTMNKNQGQTPIISATESPPLLK